MFSSALSRTFTPYHARTRCSDVQPVGSQTPNCCRYEDEPDEPSDGADSADVAWWEEERASLQHSLRALQTQFASERARREELQREAEMLTGENAALEQQVSGMEACRVGGTDIYVEILMLSDAKLSYEMDLLENFG